MQPTPRRHSRLFALDEKEVFFLEESPFFRVEIPLRQTKPEPPAALVDESEPLALAAHDEADLEDAALYNDGIIDYDGPIELSIGSPVVVEDDSMEVIQPRPFVVASTPAYTPLRWEIPMLVGSVYLLFLGGLLWG